MRAFIFAAGAALTLAACGGGGTEANEANSTDLEVNNLVVNDPAALGMDANLDANLDANATLDASTENAVAEDLTTNAPDANLANGT